jgi:hypothetical protein
VVELAVEAELLKLEMRVVDLTAALVATELTGNHLVLITLVVVEAAGIVETLVLLLEV